MTAVPRPLRALLVYTGIVIALAFPLVAHLGSVVANDLGDPLLNTWILWWNSVRLPLTSAWWNAPAFYPAPDVLAFSEHLLGLALFTTPVIWLTGNAQLAYNVAFLLTFLLSAWGAYFLGWVLTKRHDTAFVVGLLYGFAPYRMAQFAHIQTMASFWMPVALAALHMYLEERRARWLVLFGIATVLQGLTNGHYLLFFPVLVALWILWFPPRGRRLATLGAVGGAYAASMLLLLPVLLRYRAVHVSHGFSRSLEDMALYSSKVTDLARGMADLWLWGPRLQHSGPGGDLFPGLTAVLLIAAAMIWARRADPSESPAPLLPRWTRLLMAIVAGFLSLSTIGLLLVGPWRVEALGVRFSATNVSRALTQALWAWLLVVATGPWARRLVRARSPLAFYAAATLAMWVLSFGPSPSIGGVEVLSLAPYRFLTLLPGYDGLRVPGRFAMLATLCLAAAAGIALAQLRARLGRRAQLALVAIAAVGALAEGWRSVPLKPLPEPSIVRADDAPGAVMELPLGDPWQDVVSVYRGIGHRHPVINGYSGYFPLHYDVLRLALSAADPSVLTALSEYGLKHVVVFHDRDRDGKWQSYVASYPGVTAVRTSANQTHYMLPSPVMAPAGATGGLPLPVVRLEAGVWSEDVERAIDGHLETRWSTGHPQAPADELVVDLGSARKVGGVELALGPFYTDFPRDLLIEGSLDKQSWVRLWQGPTGGLAVAAAIEDSRRLPVRIAFQSFNARHLRLRQLGSDPVFYWTVAELLVLGAPQPSRPPIR